MGIPGGSAVENPSANARDVGSIPGFGRTSWRMKQLPTQVFLENSMDRGAWLAIVHGVAKS